MQTLKKIPFCLAILLLFSTAINAQQLTLSTGPDWKDALLLHSFKPAESYMATTNYNNYPRISAALYQELRTKKKQAKDKYLKDHPGFAFSKEDLEMDF